MWDFRYGVMIKLPGRGLIPLRVAGFPYVGRIPLRGARNFCRPFPGVPDGSGRSYWVWFTALNGPQPLVDCVGFSPSCDDQVAEMGPVMIALAR